MRYAYADDQFAVGLAFQKRFEESIAEMQRAEELDPLNPQIAIDACLPLIWKGDRSQALAESEELQRMSPKGWATAFDSALVALGLGDRAGAVSLLEQAYALDSQWLGWLNNDRAFDPLRSGPRFRVLMKKLGFES